MLKTIARLAVFSTFLLLTGCPHRSPLWSPDGSRVLVLAGTGREEVDKAASGLWLVELESGKPRALRSPEEKTRYLAAAWLDAASFAVLTGRWENEAVVPGSEKVYQVALQDAGAPVWTLLKFPSPSEARATRRPPVVIRTNRTPDGKWKPADRALVYPVADEQVIAVEIGSGKEILKLEPAEVVGPGPEAGFLVYRPAPEDTGTIEVVAFGGDLKVLWRRKLSELRDAIAAKLGKAPVEIVFNDTTTSHLPPPGEEGWVGLTLIFSDVGWKDGIPGYYLHLDARTGGVLSVIRGVGLSGRPASAGGMAWAVLAPDSRSGAPVRIEALRLEDGKQAASAPLAEVAKETVHGYSVDPTGKLFALSVCGSPAELRIFKPGDLGKPMAVKLAAER